MGHALEGNIHIIFAQPNLGKPENAKKFDELMLELCDAIVNKFDGSLKVFLPIPSRWSWLWWGSAGPPDKESGPYDSGGWWCEMKATCGKRTAFVLSNNCQVISPKETKREHF